MGLGNPGEKYARTRHNIGFMVVDELARRFSMETWKKKDDALQVYDSRRKLVLVKPTSFMNSSGVPVRLIASWYRSAPEDILVISDEMDLPFGALRMRARGGHGGHNGLRSVIGTMTEEFPRVRVGIGRPEYESMDHVLSTFSADELTALPKIIEVAADGAQRWFTGRIDLAMQYVNSTKPLGEAISADTTGKNPLETE
ncbi:MAG: aminoacyl-tRNA hydrolase [Candidatus Eremiobacteraeota bacterium]|nr:aminoacyl-tRNA hydrolase [Candidatus Eremiobacteraeota bacterium]